MKEDTQVFGIRAVIEAIEAGKTIEKIFIQKGLSGSLFQELNSVLKNANIPVSYVPVQKLDKLSKGNHQGVVAKMSPVEYVELEELLEKESDKPKLFILLDGLTDVRNFGAIIRTAECCGADGIIFPEHGSAPLNSDAVKTSAGAAFRIPLSRVGHIKDALFFLQSYGIKVVSATEKTNDLLYDIDLKQDIAIVVGNEAQGISSSVLTQSDYRAKLPMYGEIASLNVSVACGAFLYEVVRQRL